MAGDRKWTIPYAESFFALDDQNTVSDNVCRGIDMILGWCGMIVCNYLLKDKNTGLWALGWCLGWCLFG